MSHQAEAKRMEAKTSTSLAAKMQGRTQPAFHLEPNRRYLSIRLVSVRALVDFITPKEDEFIYCSISFLRQRFQTPAVAAAAELHFNEEEGGFLFDIDETSRSAMIDPALLLKLNQSIHLTILKQKKHEKAVVLGSKNLDWRAVLHSNSIEVNAEILPVDLAKSGPMCVAQLHLDLLPALGKMEALSEEAVSK